MFCTVFDTAKIYGVDNIPGNSNDKDIAETLIKKDFRRYS